MKTIFNYKSVLNEIATANNVSRCITDEESEELKNCLYKMAIDLDERCRKHGIKLLLVGGTLLGAVRHKGFIPWDDDMDFGLIRSDYEKLKQIFETEFSDEYMLRCPNSSHPNGNRFMQIYKKGTVLKTIDNANPLQPQAVYIDIFPYDYVPDNNLMYCLKGIYANVVMFIASCVMDDKYMNSGCMKILKKSTRGKILLQIRHLVGRLFSFESPIKWFARVDSAIYCVEKSKRITSGTGRNHYFKETYPTGVILPLTELKFIDHLFYAPGKYEDYLVGNYGKDYMKIPETGKRESHFITEIEI